MNVRLLALSIGFWAASLGVAGAEALYDVDISGVPSSILAGFKNDSQLIRLEKVPPEDDLGLMRRADMDAQSLRVAMRGDGYFGAKVDVRIDRSGDVPVVHLVMDKGDVYNIGAYALVVEPDVGLVKRDELPVGQPALVQTVLAPEGLVLEQLTQTGYPVPQATQRVLHVNHVKKQVDVDIVIASGPKVRFGATEFEGLKNIDESYLRRRVAWKEGELFDVRLVDKTRRDLSATGLIRSMDIVYDANGHAMMPVMIDVHEAKMRSIGAGAGYSTSTGLEANVFWEHRNLFGAGEKLKVALDGGLETQMLSVAFAKPDLFKSRDYKFSSQLKIGQEDLEAYKKRTVSSVNTISWKVNSHLELSGGFGLEQSRVTPKNTGIPATFTLLSVPMMALYNTVDNALDPRSGIKLAVGVTPYYALNKKHSFNLFDVIGSHYWPISDTFVWANRARFAVLAGGDLSDIPADKRLYSGGSGSVRGFGYQKLGPQDANGKPTGGKALLELGTEIRYDLTDTIGVVGFVEGGRLSESVGGGGDLKWGGGIGGRYKTVAGPVRLDVAVPFNKERGDRAYQIYVGLGQAF